MKKKINRSYQNDQPLMLPTFSEWLSENHEEMYD